MEQNKRNGLIIIEPGEPVYQTNHYLTASEFRQSQGLAHSPSSKNAKQYLAIGRTVSRKRGTKFIIQDEAFKASPRIASPETLPYPTPGQDGRPDSTWG